MMVWFQNGVMGQMYFSCVYIGCKMGYVYEVIGIKGVICFDQEDQNVIWFYCMSDLEVEWGFWKVLMGFVYLDYLLFCQGLGYGIGYQDQIIIEVKDFLIVIEWNENIWLIFWDGLEVKWIVEVVFVFLCMGVW